MGRKGQSKGVVIWEGPGDPLLSERERHLGPESWPGDRWGVGGVEIGWDEVREPRREGTRGWDITKDQMCQVVYRQTRPDSSRGTGIPREGPREGFPPLGRPKRVGGSKRVGRREGCGEAGSRRAYGRWCAGKREGGHSSLVCKQKSNRREGCLHCQYVDMCSRETVSYPALDPVPEYIQLLDHCAVRDEEVRPVGRHR